MKGWILYNYADYKRNTQFVELLNEEGKKLSIEFELLLVENITFGIENNKLFFKYNAKEIDLPEFVISRTIYPLLSRQLELMGVKVYNNSMVSDICNDKAKTYQFLANKGIDIVPTTFIKKEYISHFEENNNLKNNHVIKTIDGHGGKEVFLYNKNTNKNPLLSKVLNDNKKDIVYQPKIEGKGCDLRVYIIGNKIIGSVLRTSKDGFKSNFSLGGDVKFYNLKENEIAIVNKVIDIFGECNSFGDETKGLSYAGIDFIIDENGKMLFNEVEDVVGARMLYSCSDINVVNLYLKFICESR